MTKKIISMMIISTFSFAGFDGGSIDKGLVYYKYLFKNELGYTGEVFTKKHSIKEWENLFENHAAGFKKEFLTTPKLEELQKSKKFEQIAPHIKAFAINYAKDSDNSPKCEE